MKKTPSQPLEIVLRYIILLAIGVLGFLYFYKILTPLTTYPSYILLNLFYHTTLIQDTLVIGEYSIGIISACIAGAAYYFLVILNLTTPMKLKKRIYTLAYALLILLILNILRIITLSILFINDYPYFDIVHKTFWHVLSTIFVILIWFSAVKIFNIKEIPVYSDLKFLKKQINK